VSSKNDSEHDDTKPIMNNIIILLYFCICHFFKFTIEYQDLQKLFS
jgi:hypothetical protein